MKMATIQAPSLPAQLLQALPMEFAPPVTRAPHLDLACRARGPMSMKTDG